MKIGKFFKGALVLVSNAVFGKSRRDETAAGKKFQERTAIKKPERTTSGFNGGRLHPEMLATGRHRKHVKPAKRSKKLRYKPFFMGTLA